MSATVDPPQRKLEALLAGLAVGGGAALVVRRRNGPEELESCSIEQPVCWTELPDPALVAVLQRSAAAGDLRSIFSAARAHSRLQQAAVLAVSSIRSTVNQEQMDSMQQYLERKGQHVSSIRLVGKGRRNSYMPPVALRQLPSRLNTLGCAYMCLQLQPGDGFRGVLGPGMPLKQLVLRHCTLIDQEQSLAAALPLLAGLEHLSIDSILDQHRGRVCFPTAVLQELQQLTFLELFDVRLEGPGEATDALQPLQALTRLHGLRLQLAESAGATHRVSADMLSASQHLTHVMLMSQNQLAVDADALARSTQLRHLYLCRCLPADPSKFARFQMLQDLGELQQLTLLKLNEGLPAEGGNGGYAPAAAYSSLTAASSNFRHLDIGHNRLPARTWQHVFPEGRLMPHLTSLNISRTCNTEGLPPLPEVARLVSCCPALKALYLWVTSNTAPPDFVPVRIELLAPLQHLSGLQTLHLAPAVWRPGVTPGLSPPAVCQLKGLQELRVWQKSRAEEGLLLELMRLRRLTSLDYVGRLNGVHKNYHFLCQVRLPDTGRAC